MAHRRGRDRHRLVRVWAHVRSSRHPADDHVPHDRREGRVARAHRVDDRAGQGDDVGVDRAIAGGCTVAPSRPAGGEHGAAAAWRAQQPIDERVERVVEQQVGVLVADLHEQRPRGEVLEVRQERVAIGEHARSGVAVDDEPLSGRSIASTSAVYCSASSNGKQLTTTRSASSSAPRVASSKRMPRCFAASLNS